MPTIHIYAMYVVGHFVQRKNMIHIGYNIKSYCEDLIVALALVLRIKNEASTRTALVEPKEMNHIRGSFLKIVIK